MKELSDQTRAFIFFGLALVIFLVWSHFFLPSPPTPQQQASSASNAQSSAALHTGPTPSAPGKPASSTTSSAPIAAEPVQETAERTVVVNSPLSRVEISNRGGVVRSWQLNKYFNDEKPPRPLDLVNADAAKELGWPLSIVLSDPDMESQANSALYQVNVPNDRLEAPATIAMKWGNAHLSITKTLKFGENYDATLDVSVLLDGKPIPFAIAWRGEFGDKDVYQASQLLTAFYQQNGKLNSLQYKKLGTPGDQTKPYDQGGPVDFAGVEDQFFAASFSPNGSEIAFWDWTQWHHYTNTNNGQTVTEPDAQVGVGPATQGPLAVNLFVGPKDLGVLSAQKPSLEGLINYGWTGIIAKPLLFSLQWIYKFIPDYGWVIVIFTLLLNMVLFPIKMWSFRSARKMQIVAPEIKAIQERYKKYSMRDPRKQKMNEEVMAVYQREGINPVGGCLPMFVQIPILWAFYRVLMYSIQLRHAPWSGTWIHDLAARDPYYILPVGMAVTMYIMQKMTPMPTQVEPAQQKMMTFMPLMFAVFFFRLSSGLNLYYFAANLVGTAQQWYLNRTHPLPSRSKFKKNRE